MINLAVINLKGILKKIGKIIFIIILIAILTNFIKLLDFKHVFSNVSIASTESIEKSIVITQSFKQDEDNKKSNIKKILESEFALFSTTEEKLMEIENMEEVT